MHNKKIIFALTAVSILIIVLIAGCKVIPPAGADTLNTEKQEINVIKDLERVTHNTFSIMKPKNWTEVQYASNIIVYLPPESSMNDSFAEKYSMIVGFVAENDTRSLRQITEDELAKSSDSQPAIEFDGNYQEARFGQLDGLEIKFIMRVPGRAIEITQLRTIHGRVGYAFSQQCVEGECKHTGVFNEMIDSFEWKNPR